MIFFSIEYTTLLENYPYVFYRNLVNFNEARLLETTLNLHTHARICLSVASIDGKQHLSEVVFSVLVEFSL